MKTNKIYTEEQKEIKKFIIIVISLIVLIIGVYLFTTFVVNKDDSKKTITQGKVQYDNIILGTLLNKSDDEYYVLVFDSTDINNTYIVNLASIYVSSNKLPLYTADLSLSFNKPFIADQSLYNKDNVEGLKVKGTTLIKVKDGSIVKFIEDTDLIIREFE